MTESERTTISYLWGKRVRIQVEVDPGIWISRPLPIVDPETFEFDVDQVREYIYEYRMEHG